MAFAQSGGARRAPSKAPAKSPAKKSTAKKSRKVPAYRRLIQAAKEVLGKNVTKKQVRQVVSAVVVASAAGNRDKAAKILKAMAAEQVVKIASDNLKIANPPTDGVMGAADQLIPTSTGLTTSMISGKNGLYTAKVHKVHFECGNKAGSWMRSLKKTNGVHKKVVYDTIKRLGLDAPGRMDLVKQVGINQKMQLAVSNTNFGFTQAEIVNLFSMLTFQNSSYANQRVYGAISKLSSEAVITSLNKYVPTYVKVSLVRLDTLDTAWLSAFTEGINTFITAQDNGAMPVLYQQNALSLTGDLGASVTVDPITPGIRASDKIKNSFDIIASKTVKLYAGDRLELSYDHHSGPGVRLDKIHGAFTDGSTDAFSPVTYSLMIESWGETVDAHRYVMNATDPISVIKATCPHSLQFEFKKKVEGMNVDLNSLEAQDDGLTNGWLDTSFATRIYSDKPIELDTVQRYNQNYSFMNLANTTTGYVVPVMSDADITKAGETR